jgi:hypothetical protein
MHRAPVAWMIQSFDMLSAEIEDALKISTHDPRNEKKDLNWDTEDLKFCVV